MNPELEKLIDLAMADGQLTEKKKEILTRKANEIGMDMDEFEMVLEGKLHLAQKANMNNTDNMHNNIPLAGTTVSNIVIQSQDTVKSNKVGDFKKCPSCGAPAQSFATKCPDCGHEFRNISANSSVSQLHTEFLEIEINIKKENVTKHGESAYLYESTLDSQIDNAKSNLITSFPVPNTKEELLEFLSLAIPEATKTLSWYDKNILRRGTEMLRKAWKSKAEQVIMKSRFSMKDDKKTLNEIEFYAQQLGIK